MEVGLEQRAVQADHLRPGSAQAAKGIWHGMASCHRAVGTACPWLGSLQLPRAGLPQPVAVASGPSAVTRQGGGLVQQSGAWCRQGGHLLMQHSTTPSKQPVQAPRFSVSVNSVCKPAHIRLLQQLLQGHILSACGQGRRGQTLPHIVQLFAGWSPVGAHDAAAQLVHSLRMHPFGD